MTLTIEVGRIVRSNPARMKRSPKYERSLIGRQNTPTPQIMMTERRNTLTLRNMLTLRNTVTRVRNAETVLVARIGTPNTTLRKTMTKHRNTLTLRNVATGHRIEMIGDRKMKGRIINTRIVTNLQKEDQTRPI